MVHLIVCVANPSVRVVCVCVCKSFTLRVEEVKYVSAVNSSLLGIGPETPRIPVTLLNAFS